MKTTIFFITLFFSVSSFANTFKHFLGNYTPIEAPHFYCDGSSTSNWLGFKNLNGVKVYLQDGEYIIEIVSVLNNSLLRSFVTTQEYDYQNIGMRNRARVTGNANSANYEVTNTSPFSKETYKWSLSKSGANFHFHINYYSHHGEEISCRGDVLLQAE